MNTVLAHAGEHGAHPAWLPWLATATAVVGILAAWYAYVMSPELPGRVSAAAGGLQRVLEAKWGFDLAFNWFASRVVVGGSERVLWKGFDAGLIDGAVNGLGAFVDAWGRATRGLQTGLLRGYALLIFGGAVLLLSYLLWVRPA